MILLGLSRPESMPNLTRHFQTRLSADPSLREHFEGLEEALDGNHSVPVPKKPHTRSDPQNPAYPGICDRILTERSEIRQHVNVFVGNADARTMGGLGTPLPEGMEISIIPAIRGGSAPWPTPNDGSPWR
jgi:hypothetical protein